MRILRCDQNDPPVGAGSPGPPTPVCSAGNLPARLPPYERGIRLLISKTMDRCLMPGA